jgi:hypothetical protein
LRKEHFMHMKIDDSTLQMALIGFQSQLADINEKVQAIQRILGPGPGKASRLSDAGRKRVAAAQRKRWAAYRNSSGAEKEAAKAKVAAAIAKARAVRWAVKAKAASSA